MLPILTFYYGIVVAIIWLNMFSNWGHSPRAVRTWVLIASWGWVVSPVLLFLWCLMIVFEWLKERW